MAGDVTEGIGPAAPEAVAGATATPFREWLRGGHLEAWLLLDFMTRELARPAPCPTRLDWAKRRFSAIMEEIVACDGSMAAGDLLRLMDASITMTPRPSVAMRRILRFLARERRWIMDHSTPPQDIARSP